MIERFSRCLVMVVADFDRSSAEALALRAFGARVVAAGLGAAAVKKAFRERGIETEGVVRSRKRVLGAALDRLGGCDAVLFAAGEWDAEFEAVREAERESAFLDGRSMRPLLAESDSRYDFLRSPVEWAAFALARAAGADADRARKFAGRQARGHEDKNTDPGAGRRSRPGSAGRRKTR
jgi:hypothetical protein